MTSAGITWTESEMPFRVGPARHCARLRIPGRLALRPALLIELCGTRKDALEHEDFRRIPDIFTAAGHYAASFDIPNHGDLVDAFGEGLTGMAAAIAAGRDVFAHAGEIGRAFIDAIMEARLVRADAVLLSGTSRGALASLHVMALDPRVLACALHAPLTHLPAPAEFSHLAGNEIAQRSSALALVDRLADRPVFMDIGMRDPRVGAEHCFAFHAALSAASRARPPVLFAARGESHGATFPSEAAYHAAAGFLLAEHAAGQR